MSAAGTDGTKILCRIFGCLPALCLFLLHSIHCNTTTPDSPVENDGFTPLTVLEDAFAGGKSNIQVLQEGRITSILPDDTAGSRHQRFIVELLNLQTLLIAHNIDLAPRVPTPLSGTMLRFFGEYEWNDKGGIIHWTHRDPRGIHIDGWLEYKEKRYQ